MLKSWTIQNFKSACDSPEIALAPLTIFTGANSSGKSTIIQSILLAAQTIQSTVYSRPIILNGPTIRLGSYKDIVSNGRENDAIFISFKLSPGVRSPDGRDYAPYRDDDSSETLSAIECGFSFSAQGADAEKERLQLQPVLQHVEIRVEHEGQEGRTSEEMLIRAPSRIR